MITTKIVSFQTQRTIGATTDEEDCTFKWSDGRTVETIGAPPIIQQLLW
jgi:hypothetical protein